MGEIRICVDLRKLNDAYVHDPFLTLFTDEEYDFEVIVKPGRLNIGPDHLSWIETGEESTNLEEGLLDAQLFAVRVADNHFVDIIHFITTGMAPKGYTSSQKKKLVVRATHFLMIVRHLFKMGADEILRQYVPDFERNNILVEAHGGAAGGHYVGKATMHKILRVGLWWPTLHKDSKAYCEACDVCQRTGRPSRRDELPL
eukprot:PITA_17205